MATWKFEGLDEYLRQLERLEGSSHDAIGKAIYHGAAIVADACKREIESLPVNNQYRTGGITSVQKAGLREGFGVAHEQEDGLYRHVKLGFDGYNKQYTKKYPKGQPNSVIARSINSGSTWRKKIPFIDRATRSSKAACEGKMAEVIDTEIKKVMI